MRGVRTTLLVATLLLAGGIVLAQSGGSYDVEWSVIGSAGEQFASGGAYQVGFTLAQDSPPLVSAGSGYQVVQGYWSGAGSAPTAVTLAGFWIEVRVDALVACWETASELDALGFSLYRSDTGEPDSFVRLNEGLIPSQVPGSPSGATYEWIDAGAEAGQTYYYLLEDVDIRGRATRHGPVPATLPPTTVNRIYLPYVNR